jgi:hypothetical protein
MPCFSINCAAALVMTVKRMKIMYFIVATRPLGGPTTNLQIFREASMMF